MSCLAQLSLYSKIKNFETIFFSRVERKQLNQTIQVYPVPIAPTPHSWSLDLGKPNSNSTYF